MWTKGKYGKYAIKFYSRWISWFVKFRDVKKLRQDIEDDTVIKDQMVSLGCLLVYVFGDYLGSILVAVRTVENLDCGDKPEFKDCESEL